MVAFQENIICGRLLQEIHDQISKIIWGRSKLSFKKTITACVFSRRPSFLMGIFFYECHFQMTDSLSFRNESYRLIFDLWVINHRQNYRFEMIAPLSFRYDGCQSFRNDDGSLFEMIDGLSLRDD